MPIQVVSTTDSTESVQAASGQKQALAEPQGGKSEGDASKTSAATKPAPEHNAVESDTSGNEAQEEVEGNEPEESQETGETEGESGEGKEGKAKKSGGGFQKRISKLTAEKSALRQELEYWKNAAVKKTPEDSQSPSKEAPKSDQPGKPKAEDYATNAEFVEAVAEWKADQKFKDYEQRVQQKTLNAERAAVANSYADRVKVFAESHQDYHEVLAEASDVPMSAAMQTVILESEQGPALAYELCKNSEEAARIAALPPMKAAIEMGKLEARIASQNASAEKPKPKTKTQAPKPLSPVAGSKSGSPDKDISDPSISQQEYEAIRAKQRAEYAKRRA